MCTMQFLLFFLVNFVMFSSNYLPLKIKICCPFSLSYYFVAFTVLLISKTEFRLCEHRSCHTATKCLIDITEGNQQTQIQVVKPRSLQEHGGGSCDISAAVGVVVSRCVVDSVDVLLGQGIDARQTGWGKDAVSPPGREQTLHQKPGNTQAHIHRDINMHKNIRQA